MAKLKKVGHKKVVRWYALAPLAVASGLITTNSASAATFSTMLETPLLQTVDRFEITDLPQYQATSDQKLVGVELSFGATVTGDIVIPATDQSQIVLANFIQGITLSLTTVSGTEENLFLASPIDSQVLRVPALQTAGETFNFNVEASVPRETNALQVISFAAEDPLVQTSFLGNGALDLHLTVTDRTTFVGAAQPPDLTRFLKTSVQVSYQTESVSPGDPPPNPNDESNTDDDDNTNPDEPVSIPEPSLTFAILLGLMGHCATLGRGLIRGNRQ